MDKQTFRQSLLEKGIEVSEQQMEQFSIYYHTLVEWNEKMNLTSITDEEEVYLKHFYDSISAAFYFDFQKVTTLCDVGAGAGFPSLPIKIIFPHLEVTIVDSLNKRITFLEHLANQLKLDKVTFYHDRAEIFGRNKQHREQYDVVSARAVARMSVLSELCLPLTKVGGTFLAMKGAKFKEEERESKKAVQILGGEWKDVFSFQLPEEDSMRYMAIIDKMKSTPKAYPRKPGTPNKNPIV
ncbi:16S rRNA (guanine(527)-N(7))-methyltransferase RsmG [Salinibacillus xinjiangensis]|uniref:Ribosomal RNA small subunit methyltransferase G n=1 Tax=Salinibacillus xinjiangensis TaxID=1229268 RepID=A0A6G1XAJ1_9BACI|nr:16S rRNA (guanine(527)-N(7))-methyltransferase RsmG [Salinibacillus xinjiangensis]MRG87957.1 16S rRNA (guanine(527)-N(7))-methyltransferase RsmG [Salinibacillus xinjiangensis]